MPSRVTRTQRAVVAALKVARPDTPVNQKFAADLMHSIEKWDKANRRKGSTNYKPSSMDCLRKMYYQRTGADQDDSFNSYQGIGMSDTGTRRHEAIQEVLCKMQELGYPWKYWDIEEWLKQHRWPQRRCKQLKVVSKSGAETLLRDEVLHVSFRTDGVLEHIEDKTGDPFYLFEFKNQIEFKAQKKAAGKFIDEEHEAQVDTYCFELELNKALVTYENRNACDLYVPVVYQSTEATQARQRNKLLEAESYAERGIAPPKPEDPGKACNYCSYKTLCAKDR